MEKQTLRQPKRGRKLSVKEVVVQHKETCETYCCKINVLLVFMQLFIGLIVTALGIYMQTLTPSLGVKEAPYWAGIPLFIAGVCGVCFSRMNVTLYSRGNTLFVIKAVCVTLSTACTFVCIVASIFSGIHGSRITSYQQCSWLNETLKQDCYCTSSDSPNARIFYYYGLSNCNYIFTRVKDYLILQCTFNAIACGVSLWLVFLLWRLKYANFHSGLTFFSYNASTQHPWMDPNSPPYSTPEFQRKLSQKRLLSRTKEVANEIGLKDKCEVEDEAQPVHIERQCTI